MKISDLSVKFSKIEKYNSQFSKGIVSIAYNGKNPNYSDIGKDVFEDMIPSLYGCPVVGEWNKENDSFGGHGGRIEVSNNGKKVEYIDTTVPFGFVPTDADVWWEEIEEEDGRVNNYIHSSVFLWTGRYPQAKSILEKRLFQSMEISVLDADLRNDGFYEIKKAEFSALCVLEGVKPAFESSKFKEFNLDKETFKTEFNLMVKELKQSLFKGGENVVKNSIEEIKDEVFEEEIVEDVVVEINEETIDETVEEETTEEETTVEVTEVTEIEVVGSEEFIQTDVEKTLSLEDYNQLLSDYEILKEENKELKSFKVDVLSQQKSNEIEDVFSKYSTLLDVADFEDLKEKAVNMDIETLEKELSFRLVQKKFDFSKIIKKDSTKITIKEDKDTKEPYGSASVYFNKQ